MSNKLFIKTIFIALLTITTFTVSNAQLKVAFINTDELLLSLPEVKAANDSLVAELGRHEQKIQSLVVELRTKAITLEQKKNEVAPIQYEKEVALLKEQEAKIGEMDELGRKALQVKQEGVSGPLEQKVNAAIKQTADELGYNYVINTSQGMVLYADPSLDILQQVKARLLKK